MSQHDPITDPHCLSNALSADISILRGGPRSPRGGFQATLNVYNAEVIKAKNLILKPNLNLNIGL